MSTTPITLRVPDDDLAEIDRRAKARGLNRTAFMLGLALAEDLARTADEARFEDIEERLSALEERLFLSGEDG
jgi:uncharacterized protein (DUF1778 family)